MKSMTWKESLEIGLATLVMFVVFQTAKPVWVPAWGPFAGAGVIFVGLLMGVAMKQKEAAEKEEQKERERQERQDKLEMDKHLATLRHQADMEEQERDSGRLRPEFVRALQTPEKEGNGQSAAPA